MGSGVCGNIVCAVGVCGIRDFRTGRVGWGVEIQWVRMKAMRRSGRVGWTGCGGGELSEVGVKRGGGGVGGGARCRLVGWRGCGVEVGATGG